MGCGVGCGVGGNGFADCGETSYACVGAYVRCICEEYYVYMSFVPVPVGTFLLLLLLLSCTELLCPMRVCLSRRVFSLSQQRVCLFHLLL